MNFLQIRIVSLSWFPVFAYVRKYGLTLNKIILVNFLVTGYYQANVQIIIVQNFKKKKMTDKRKEGLTLSELKEYKQRKSLY